MVIAAAEMLQKVIWVLMAASGIFVSTRDADVEAESELML